MAYITLDSIIKEVLADDADTLHLYPDYLRYALRACSELQYDVVKQIKSVMLTLSPAYTAELPKDYVDYTKIAIRQDNGNLNVLGVNNNICLIPKLNDCGDAISTNIVSDTRTYRPDFATWRFYNFVYFGVNRGTLFGYGGGYNLNGAYRINLDAWQIQFSSDVILTNSVVLEYVTNGINDEMNTLVNEYEKEAIIAFVNWKKVLPKRNIGIGEKRYFEDLYYAEAFKLRRRINSFTLNEFKAAVRYNFHQGVKE